jgi:hypothetical protein
VARRSLRSRREVVERIRELGAELRGALGKRASPAAEPAVVDALWQGEGLGTLLWALELAPLPPYDRTYDPERLLVTRIGDHHLRDRSEIEHARESARLWHWRARTALLRDNDGLELPAGWASFEQLIAVAALRGHERGLLPAPLRGDFPAYGTGYRALSSAQQLQTLSIAFERHRALNWLCDRQHGWSETLTDT